MKTSENRIHSFASIFTGLFIIANLSFGDAVLIEVEPQDRVVRVEAWNNTSSDWHSIAQAYLHNRSGTVKIQIPSSYANQNLRVMSSPNTAPGFVHRLAHSIPAGAPAANVPFRFSFDGGLASAVPEADLYTSEEAAGTAIQEADIWKNFGDRSYIFNQRRGLQIVNTPADGEPALLGSLRLPAVGDELYPLPNQHILLITNDNANLSTRLKVVSVQDDDPRLLPQSIPLQGHYMDSRMVGNRLHIITQLWNYNHYRDATFRLYSIDFSDPTQAAITDEPLLISSNITWGNVHTLAHPDFLFLAIPAAEGYSWAPRTDLLVFDLAADQSAEYRTTLELAGNLKDKFKLHVAGDTLVTVTEWRDGQSFMNVHTALETWDLSDPNVAKLGDIELAPEETLFATHFQGTMAYIVTFLIIDPLFAIDFSDPRHPLNMGELDVPGFSTYMQLDGNMLISIGVEDRRVAISLFDIRDPAKMFLRDRLYLGDKDGHSWSEGNYDDRAITIDRTSKRIMLPFNAYGAEAGPTQGLAVVSYANEELTALGTLNFTDSYPRRSQVSGDQWLAFAETQFHAGSLNPQPKIDSTLNLAWDVQYLEVVNDQAYQWGDNNTLYVSDTRNPDQLIGKVSASTGTPVGVTRRGDQLHLLTHHHRNYPENATLRHEIWEVRSPELPQKIGSVDLEIDSETYYALNHFSPVWRGDALLWISKTGQRYFFSHRSAIRPMPGLGLVDTAMPHFNWQTQWTSIFIDTSDPGDPRPIKVKTESYANGIQKNIFIDPYLFVNTSRWETDADGQNDPDASDEQTVIPRGPSEVLQVWDFSDAAAPTMLASHDIPATLESVDMLDDGWFQLNLVRNHFSYQRVEVVNPIPDEGGPKPDDRDPYDYHYQYRYDHQIYIMVWDGVQLFLADQRNLGRSPIQSSISSGDNLLVTLQTPTDDAYRIATWYMDWDAVKLRSGYAEERNGSVWSVEHFQNNRFMLRDASKVEWLDITPSALTSRLKKSVSGAIPLELDRARKINENQLWVPAGMFGIEVFSLPDNALQTLQAHATAPQSTHAETASWSEIASHRWQVTAASVGDLGALAERRWLFREADWQPLFAQTEDLGDARHRHTGLGTYYDTGLASGWIYHYGQGWMRPTSEHNNGRILQSAAGQWLWAREDLLPWVFDFTDATWKRIR